MYHLIYSINGKEYSFINCKYKRIFEGFLKALTLRHAEIVRIWED